MQFREYDKEEGLYMFNIKVFFPDVFCCVLCVCETCEYGGMTQYIEILIPR